MIALGGDGQWHITRIRRLIRSVLQRKAPFAGI